MEEKIEKEKSKKKNKEIKSKTGKSALKRIRVVQ